MLWGIVGNILSLLPSGSDSLTTLRLFPFPVPHCCVGVAWFPDLSNYVGVTTDRTMRKTSQKQLVIKHNYRQKEIQLCFWLRDGFWCSVTIFKGFIKARSEWSDGNLPELKLWVCVSVVVAQVCCRQTDGTSFSSEPEETHTHPPPSISFSFTFPQSSLSRFSCSSI